MTRGYLLPATAALGILAGCTGDPYAHLWNLRVGDCLNDPVKVERESIVEVEEVACDEAHHAELFARIDHPGLRFPGFDALSAYAESECQPAFAAFVGRELEDSELELYTIWPSSTSWADGDREILCGLFDPHGPLVGSMRDGDR